PCRSRSSPSGTTAMGMTTGRPSSTKATWATPARRTRRSRASRSSVVTRSGILAGVVRLALIGPFSRILRRAVPWRRKPRPCADNLRMPLYRDEAVVLRTHKLGEADRIVTMLSRQHGKIRAVAKGVRRTASKFGSRLEPFMVADVQLYEGRSLDIITQAESLGSYGADITDDYASYTAASAMVETADKITDDSGSLQQYLLLVGALRSLA